MFSFKQSTANRLLVGLVDPITGLGITAVAFNDAGLSFKLAKNGAAEATKTLSAPDWFEAGHGWYWVTLSTSECDTLGLGLLITLYTGGVEGSYPFQIVANLTSDVFTRLGAPAGASIAADLATIDDFVDTEVAAIKAKTDNLPALPASQGDVTTVGTAVAAVSTKLGTPAGASVSADVAAVNAKTTNLPSDPADQSDIIAATSAIFSRLGAPAGASVSADIAAVKASADAAVVAAFQAVRAALGLYMRIESPNYNASTPDLHTARVRFYDTQAHYDTNDGVTGLVVPEFTRTVNYSATALAGTAHQILNVGGRE